MIEIYCLKDIKNHNNSIKFHFLLSENSFLNDKFFLVALVLLQLLDFFCSHLQSTVIL